MCYFFIVSSCCMKNLLLDNVFFNSPVFYTGETPSTMDLARELSLSGSPSGTVVAAGYQSMGRGRGRGRKWEAPPGSSLLFTLFIETSSLGIPVHHAPVAAGLGMCRYLKSKWGFDPCLKWPNDILVGGRKICGILCESTQSRLYVGVGLNCNQADRNEFPDLNIKATSVRLEAGLDSAVDPLSMLSGLLSCIREVLLPAGGAGDLIGEADALLYRRGETVFYREGAVENGTVSEAVILGISKESGLRLMGTDGKEFVSVTGEILYPGYSKGL